MTKIKEKLEDCKEFVRDVFDSDSDTIGFNEIFYVPPSCKRVEGCDYDIWDILVPVGVCLIGLGFALVA